MHYQRQAAFLSQVVMCCRSMQAAQEEAGRVTARAYSVGQEEAVAEEVMQEVEGVDIISVAQAAEGAGEEAEAARQ
jgi:hypothetical protein